MLSFTKNRDQPRNRHVCLTTPLVLSMVVTEYVDLKNIQTKPLEFAIRTLINLVAELVSKSNRSLGDWVRALWKVSQQWWAQLHSCERWCGNRRRVDLISRLCLAFTDWRSNLRNSNTEPLVRLNIETRSGADSIEAPVAMISERLLGWKTWTFR